MKNITVSDNWYLTYKTYLALLGIEPVHQDSQTATYVVTDQDASVIINNPINPNCTVEITEHSAYISDRHRKILDKLRQLDADLAKARRDVEAMNTMLNAIILQPDS